MTKLAPYAKAITGTVITGLGALGTALTDGGVSPVEWVAIATATLTASLAIWAVDDGRRTPPAGPAGDNLQE